MQDSALQENVQSLEESFTVVITDLCSCDIDLNGSSITCSGQGKEITFQTTMVYSSESGDITASDVLTMFEVWTINTPDPSLSIDGETANIRDVCVPTCTPEPTMADTESSTDDIGMTVGIAIGGFLLGIAFVAIPTIITW